MKGKEIYIFKNKRVTETKEPCRLYVPGPNAIILAVI